MPNMVQGFGPQGFEPSGGPQTMSAEQKLQSMIEAMGGAPNSVLQMIARILKGGEGAAPPQPQQWDSNYPMPAPPQFRGAPGIPNVNGAFPTRPSYPEKMPMMSPNPGFVRG